MKASLQKLCEDFIHVLFITKLKGDVGFLLD